MQASGPCGTILASLRDMPPSETEYSSRTGTLERILVESAPAHISVTQSPYMLYMLTLLISVDASFNREMHFSDKAPSLLRAAALQSQASLMAAFNFASTKDV